MTALYTVLHFLVDGLCALAMFGRFMLQEKGYFYMLVYNFCAFALQMPFGLLLDMAGRRTTGYGEKGWRDPAFATAAAGVLCTIAGVVTHPAILGIGNALFHVGGGVGTIHEDRAKKWRGRGLGVFVAPGAMGLFLGTGIAKSGSWRVWYPWVSVWMVLLCLGVCLRKHCRVGTAAALVEEGSEGDNLPGERLPETDLEKDRSRTAAGSIRLAVCCLAVVILRSYVGMAVTFPWKTGMLAGALAILAVAGGKAAGGFCAAQWGYGRTAVVSLAVAAICYLFSCFMPAGLAAVFFFNMTMPITLYWMAESMPRMPGFAFGYLTFALFLGFLPGYFGFLPWADGIAWGGTWNVPGCMGSVLSLLLLAAGKGRRRK